MSHYLLKTSLLLLSLFFVTVASSAHAVIQVREVELAELSLDEVGVLTDKNGGLGADIWRNTPHHYVEKLIALLPQEVSSNTLRDMKKRLLATAAVPPLGSSEKKADLFTLRLRQLAKMGEHQMVADMVENVPNELRTEEMIQIIIAARLNAGEAESACQAITANVVMYESIEWRKWTALCQARNGQKAAAKLTLKLLADNGFEVNEDFQLLLDGMASEDKAKLDAEKKWQMNVSELVLRLPGIEVYTPSQKFLDADLMFNAQASSWWKRQDTKTPQGRVEALVKLYGILVGLGDTINADDWLDLALYTIKHVEEKSVHYQLADVVSALAAQGRKGDAVMIAIKIFGDKLAKEVPPAALRAVLAALSALGYEKEANLIAREALE